MNIAIDLQILANEGSRNRGIGLYTLNQVKEIIRQDKTNNYFLFNIYNIENLPELLDIDENADNVKEFNLYSGNNKELLANNMLVGAVIQKFIVDFNIDIFFVTSLFENFFEFKASWFKNTKLVVTVYDIIPHIFKEVYLKDKTLKNQYYKTINFALEADKILAISNSVKNDLIKHFNANEKKLTVAYAGIDDTFKKLTISDKEKNDLFKKYNIKTSFIMFAGGGDPRKNLKEMIVAYAKLSHELKQKFQLLIVCQLSEDIEAILRETAHENKVDDYVIMTGFVPSRDLILLYNLAHLVAFPSKYEGFGLPAVEAFACGTPLLTSNNSSLGEIAKDAAVLVDPFDIKSITKGLTEALTKTDFSEMIKKGYEKAEIYTWKAVAKRSINVFNSLKSEKTVKYNRSKIAMFTPLPPLKSGISDYSYDIICELSNYYDIDVFIDDGYKPNSEFSDKVTVFNHKDFHSKRTEYKEVIYQVGNSDFHFYMISYIRNYEGIVVIHDANLHGFAYEYSLKKDAVVNYKQIFKDDYPDPSLDYYADGVNNKTMTPDCSVLINGFLANYAKKIIVHSDYGKHALIKNNINRSIYKIHHYVKNETPSSGENVLINKFKIDKNKTIVASFGIAHQSKRIHIALEALSKIVNDDNIKNIQYLIVGRFLDNDPYRKEILDLIKIFGLSEYVVVTGFTSIDEFKQIMALSDICVNLRYPYNGETSGSFMRILAQGKPSIVTDIGAFSEVPDSCCFKISPPVNDEISEYNELYNCLKALITNPDMRANLSKNALEYAKTTLDIKKIAEKYQKCIESCDDFAVIGEEYITGLSEHMRESVPESLLWSEIYDISKTLSYLYTDNTEGYIKNTGTIDIEEIMQNIRKRKWGFDKSSDNQSALWT